VDHRVRLQVLQISRPCRSHAPDVTDHRVVSYMR